jgi:hypothetical protein
MALSVSISRLNRRLMKTQGTWDLTWADAVCTDSRSVHMDVWIDRPDADYVCESVLPLLCLARDTLLAMVECSHLDEATRTLVRIGTGNIEARIANIKTNYLTGGPSGLAQTH